MFIALALVLVSLLLIGIGITVKPIETSEYPMTVVDQMGRTVSLPKEPENIISLAPSNTEILFALGLGDKVIGVTTYCDYPPEATEKEKIGGFSTVDVEKVVSLHPDLVVATGGVQTKFVEQLEDLGVSVIVLDPENLDEILEGIELVGKVTGVEDRARELVDNMQQRIEYITSKTEDLSTRPKVFYVTWHDPLWTAGRDTFQDAIITLAGGNNIASDTEGYFVYDPEMLVTQDPDVIILGAHGITPAEMESLSWWSELKAVKENRVYTIDPDITSRPGPRVVEALEQVAQFLHPELFQLATA